MSKSNTIQNEIRKTIVMFVIYAVAFIILLSALSNSIQNKNAHIFGYSARIVATGSMEPEIKVNSISIIKACDINDIEVGDIVCFKYNQDIIHRVIKKTVDDNGNIILNTQGDANEYADAIEINSDMVIGKVVRTFNGVSGIIDKYSIKPGVIDGISLGRDAVILAIIIGIILVFIYWIACAIKVWVKLYKQKYKFNDNIQTYINDINELIAYREIILEIALCETENRKETKFEHIGNHLSKIKTEMDLREIHSDIKRFKKALEHSLFIKYLMQELDKEPEKENKKTMKEIIEQVNNINNQEE